MVSVRSKKSRSIVISTVARTAIKGAFALFLAGLVVLTVVLLSCSHAMSQDYALMIDPDFLTITAEMRIEASSSPSVDSLPRSSQERSPPKKKKKNGRHQHEFIITFVGDTMLQNTGYNWETAHHGNYWNPADGFQYLKPLLNRTDYLIMNLEGPITTLPITVDVKPRMTFNFSFGMHPRVAEVIKELGVDAVNLANNHQADRNMQGWLDTKMHLDNAGIRHFGSGLTSDEQAEPLMIDVPAVGKKSAGKVGITGFMEDGYCCDEVPVVNANRIEYPNLTLRPTMAELAMSLLEKRGATIKIAFPHWLGNYVTDISPKVVARAERLASAGYDLIVGSDGSHTVKEFDYITAKRIPCFYDIGNFVFQKWGRFRTLDNGKKVLPYGTVTHVVLDHGKLDRLEIFCTLINNDVVNYQPRPCTPFESLELFSSLGPHLHHREGDTFAIVHLRPQNLRPVKRKKK